MEKHMAERIGELIRNLRTARGMTLRGLAKAAGIAPGTISYWESGKTQPRVPELDVVLDALQCPESLRREAYTLINAPRAVAKLRHTASLASVLGEEELAWLPASGDLLRSLRMRQGLTLEQAAAKLGVQPSTISRWEHSKSLSSENRLIDYCHLLNACTEERNALTNLFLNFPLDGVKSRLSLEELEQRLEQLRQDALHGETAQMELRFLALERQLWPRADRHQAAWHLLARTYVWHAQWLLWQERLSEAGQVAEYALNMFRRERRPQRYWIRAIHVYATYLADGGKRVKPGVAAGYVQDWLPAACWPDMEAWMYHNLATYQMRVGQVADALASVEKAQAAAERSANPIAIRNSGCDSAAILLQVGRPEEAIAWLSTEEQPNIYHRVYEAHIWATALLMLGDKSGAEQWVKKIEESCHDHYPMFGYVKALLNLL
jgi:transcriptional regulator with XRE-family HTH domain